ERTVDYIHLLLTSETNEVHGISRDADRQVRVFFRMIHAIQKGVAIQDIHVHVVTRNAEESVKHASQICNPVLRNSSEPLGNQRGSKRDAIGGVTERNFCNRRSRGVNAVLVAAMHGIGARREGLAPTPSIRSV